MATESGQCNLLMSRGAVAVVSPSGAIRVVVRGSDAITIAQATYQQQAWHGVVCHGMVVVTC